LPWKGRPLDLTDLLNGFSGIDCFIEAGAAKPHYVPPDQEHRDLEFGLNGAQQGGSTAPRRKLQRTSTSFPSRGPISLATAKQARKRNHEEVTYPQSYTTPGWKSMGELVPGAKSDDTKAESNSP